LRRVSAMKRPDIILQYVYNETSWFWRDLKIGKYFVFHVLWVSFMVQEFKLQTKYRLTIRLPSRRTDSAHIEVCWLLKLALKCCVTDICYSWAVSLSVSSWEYNKIGECHCILNTIRYSYTHYRSHTCLLWTWGLLSLPMEYFAPLCLSCTCTLDRLLYDRFLLYHFYFIRHLLSHWLIFFFNLLNFSNCTRLWGLLSF
jgi:hypothetical protein